MCANPYLPGKLFDSNLVMPVRRDCSYATFLKTVRVFFAYLTLRCIETTNKYKPRDSESVRDLLQTFLDRKSSLCPTRKDRSPSLKED